MLPVRVRHWIRRSAVTAASAGNGHTPASARPIAGIATTPAVTSMDLATFMAFTVDDLFYADRDLDRAMDLLAICEV
jgi:hypothetical protein